MIKNELDIKFFEPDLDFSKVLFDIESNCLEKCEQYSLNIIKENLDKHINIVASLNDKYVGYICCSNNVYEAELLKVCVVKEYQRHNIGSMLVEKLISKLKESNIDELYLEVRSNNIKAIRFYEKIGFKRIAIRNNYYADGTNAVVYKYIIP